MEPANNCNYCEAQAEFVCLCLQTKICKEHITTHVLSDLSQSHRPVPITTARPLEELQFEEFMKNKLQNLILGEEQRFYENTGTTDEYMTVFQASLVSACEQVKVKQKRNLERLKYFANVKANHRNEILISELRPPVATWDGLATLQQDIFANWMHIFKRHFKTEFTPSLQVLSKMKILSAGLVPNTALHTTAVNSLDFLKQTSSLVSSSTGEIKLWNLAGFACSKTIELKASSFYRSMTAFEEHGLILVSNGPSIEAYQIHEGTQAFAIDAQEVVSKTKAVDNKLIAASGGKLKLFEITSQGLSTTYDVAPRPILSFDISKDKTKAYVIGQDAVLRIWDLNSNQEITKYPAIGHVPTALKFVEDAIAISNNDGCLVLADTNSRSFISSNFLNRFPITSLEYLKCSRQILTGRTSGFIDVYDIRSRCDSASFNTGAEVTAMKVVKEARVLAAASKTNVSIIEY